MAKLYFYYSAMNAGKSTVLLQSAHNYRERGMQVTILTSELDDREAVGYVTSRIGLKNPADTYNEDTNLYAYVRSKLQDSPLSCVLVDDVIATGHTIIQAANLLKQYGASAVYVYATHATIPERLPIIMQEAAIDEVVVTDTIAEIDKKYAKLSVSAEISASIKLSNGDSDENQSRD